MKGLAEQNAEDEEQGNPNSGGFFQIDGRSDIENAVPLSFNFSRKYWCSDELLALTQSSLESNLTNFLFNIYIYIL